MKFLRWIGFFLLCVVVFAYASYRGFPWETAKQRLALIAAKEANIGLEIEHLGPSGLLGVRAESVEITLADGKNLRLREISAHLHLLPLLLGRRSFSVDAPIAQGRLEADIDLGGSDMDVELNAAGIQLDTVPLLRDALGIPLVGQADLEGTLHFEPGAPEKSAGHVNLRASGLATEKGADGLLGGMEIKLGDLDWKLPIENGKVQADALSIDGGDFRAKLSGEVALRNPLSRSVLNLTAGFSPSDAFTKREPMLAAMLVNLQRAKGKDGFYSYAITGPIGRPHRPRPRPR